MTTTPRIAQSDLENTLGAATVAQWFDDDGDGVADAALVTVWLRRATARVEGLLYASFNQARLDLVAADERFVDLLCWVALGMACQRRPEWMMPNGAFPYSLQKKEAEQELLAIAKGLDRFKTEETATPNPLTQGSSTVGTYAPPVFARSPSRPGGSGGF